ncbi:Sec-independent protein translocase protein TatB [Nioella aestuarii]|uniref:Sec-independent protein translocase protein TatB n=1 Tax=Nioella aestuarii TaxID=1662864 RepID=UPI003D7F2906
MFDIGMWELMVVGIVALIVVGPKDLPKMFRTLGQVTGRIRGMAREFQTTMNAAASETGLDEMAKDLKKATDITRDLRKVTSPRKMGMEAMRKAAGSALDGDDASEPERPLTETEKLAQQRHKQAEERVAAAQERAAARASAAVEAAEDAAAVAQDDLPRAEPRTGTADT